MSAFPLNSFRKDLSILDEKIFLFESQCSTTYLLTLHECFTLISLNVNLHEILVALKRQHWFSLSTNLISFHLKTITKFWITSSTCLFWQEIHSFLSESTKYKDISHILLCSHKWHFKLKNTFQIYYCSDHVHF